MSRAGSGQAPEAANAVDERVHQMEQFVGRALQAGVWGSAVLIVLGLLLAILRPGVAADPSNSVSPSVGRLASGLARGDGVGFVVIGLVLLIATPVLRVAISIILFARQADLAYVVITSGVFALLIISFLAGATGG